MAMAGADSFAIMKAMGHTDIKTYRSGNAVQSKGCIPHGP